MTKTLTSLVLLCGAVASVAHSQSTPQGQSSAEAQWRARRTADSVCATFPVARSDTAPFRVRRDVVSGRECRKSGIPTLTAFVLTDHLICPSATPWNDPNPLELLNVERIASIEVRRDSLTFAKWNCSSPVDAVIIVTAKQRAGS